MTRSQLRRLLENADYWRDRETAQREAYILTEEEEMREVNRIYRDMYRWAEREISAFYGRYADAEGIDITEAKRRVSNLDIERYEELAKKYVADKDFSDRANQEMRLYNATMRINRMELLKAQIGLKLVDGFNDIDKHYEKIATDRATQELERMSGILGNTLTDTQTAKYARNVVNADFYNANFSERIWSHMDNLRNDLAIELQKGFIAGVSTQEMARRIKDNAFDKSYRDAHRLVVTELRRVQTDVAKQQYEEAGIEEYEYCAVNPRACPICRDQDGKVFKVADMKAGENAPPLHPNCHCTTAPKVDETGYEQWLSWLENGGTTEQWDQMSPTERQNWYDSIVQSIPNTPSTDIRTRADAEQSLFDMGFERIEDSVSRLPDDVLISQTKRLQKLEKRFGMIGKSVSPSLSAMNDRNANAYVSHKIKNPNDQDLSLCSQYYGQGLEHIISNQRHRSNVSKWSMPCAEDMLEWYTVTHEYGHLIHNILLSESIDSMDTFKTRATTMAGKYKAYNNYQTKVLGEWDKEIIAIAKKNNPDFVLSDNISGYGKTNNAEFFAEVFANSQCGKPNELGKAMNEWLKGRGL